MAPSIPGFGVALLQRAMDYANRAYQGTSAFSGFKMITSNTKNSKYHPNFFVIESDSSLYIVVRGSGSGGDWETNFDYREQYGTFGNTKIRCHGGFLKAAQNTFDAIKDKIKDYKGNVYVTGHSLGGCVSIPLGLLIMTDSNTKNLKTSVLAFAPAPTLEYIPSTYTTRIVTIANDQDIVCTMSIPCCHNLVKPLIPKSGVPKALLKTALKISLRYLEKNKETFGENLYNAAMNSIDSIVDDLAEYHKSSSYLHVKYLPGLIYKLDDEHTKLSTCVSSPSQFNTLSISAASISDHYQSDYIYMLSRLTD